MPHVARFNPKSMLAEAAQAAGGHMMEAVDRNYHPALSALTQSLDDDARLTSNGAAALRRKLVNQLTERFRVENFLAEHPEAEEEPVAPPLIITGLPHPGVYNLHRMLASDPRFHWLALWESQTPAPLPGESIRHPDRRIARTEAMVHKLHKTVPQLTAIHPMSAQAPDEESMLMEHALHAAFSAYAYVPGYVKWLDSHDATPAYRYLRRALSLLQWQQRQRGITANRWVLRSPVHMRHMDTLLRVFPDAQVIQTHIDPVTSVPDLAGFIYALWSLYSDDISPETTGQTWSKRMQRSLTHTMNARARFPAEQFLDIEADKALNTPMDTLERIYQFIGCTLDEDTAAHLRKWPIPDTEGLKEQFSYQPSDFGLNEGQLREDFADYRARYIGVKS